jgi:PKD repeat protein
MRNLAYLFSILIVVLVASCEPYQDQDIVLGDAPATPEFTIELMPGDSNTIIVTDLSEGNFARVWNFGENADGQTPLKKTSTAVKDTVTYVKAGTYTITLYVSAQSGGGTNQNSKTVTIENDAATTCSGTVALLTGDCLPNGRCWTLSQAAGAITVGPAPGDGSWYSSPAGGLVPEQYDDSYCFLYIGNEFQYNNNGGTVNPFIGYVVEPFTVPDDAEWTYSPGTGQGGVDQIILPVGLFMGVRDASNVLDIISISETELVVRAPIVNEDGTPNNNGGWFELYFVAI